MAPSFPVSPLNRKVGEHHAGIVRLLEGGRIEFQRLSTGSWIITYWHVRMPLLESSSAIGPGNPSRKSPGSVVGPNSYNCSQWVAYVTGATSPLTYAWSGFFTGSDNYVAGTIPQSGADFQLIVVDSQDRQGGAVKHVSYNSNHLDYCQ